jgi:hypothetical protein
MSISPTTSEPEAASSRESIENKFINPGFGLVIMGAVYIAWWCLLPAAIDAFTGDNRWAHNWAFAIIILTVGASWYQKSPVSRTIAAIEAFMLPVTASGSVNTILMTLITLVLCLAWVLVVGIERARKHNFLETRLQKRATLWITMHAQVVAWILIAHMGLVFLVGRIPFELQFMSLGVNLDTTRIAFLQYLPSELFEIASWVFDVFLISWALIALHEQIKMGYNLQEKPWPKLGFWWTFVTMGASLVGLVIQVLLFGL